MGAPRSQIPSHIISGAEMRVKMEKTLLGRTEEYYIRRSAVHTVTEILQQPALWRRLADVLCGREEEIHTFMEEVMAVEHLRIVFTGAGSSAFVGESMQCLLANEMGILSETIHTTDFISMPDSTYADVPTLLISYARSGESPESCATIRFAEKKISRLYQVIIVCDKNSSLARLGYASKNTLVLDMPPEACDQGFAMTSSVSCMALATWCLFHHGQISVYADHIRALADSAERDMEQLDKKAFEIAQKDYRRLIWLGTGAMRGLAREGAVKSMELTNGCVHAGYDAATGFRHGPKTVINDETLTVHFLSNQPYSLQYDVDLARELVEEKKKNLVAVVTGSAHGGMIPGADYEVTYEIPESLPANSEMGAYIKGLLFVQLLSLEKSLEKNMTMDNPCPGGEVNRVVRGVVIYDI